MKKLFQKDFDARIEFIELEEADGQTVFVTRYSVMKFREHVATSGSGPIPPKS